jgi:hypothetical protein
MKWVLIVGSLLTGCWGLLSMGMIRIDSSVDAKIDEEINKIQLNQPFDTKKLENSLQTLNNNLVSTNIILFVNGLLIIVLSVAQIVVTLRLSTARQNMALVSNGQCCDSHPQVIGNNKHSSGSPGG